MSKQILPEGPIYVAPGMLGQYENGEPVVEDSDSGRSLDPRTLNDKIAIYEREVKGWFLDPALRLLESDEQSSTMNNAFVIVMICMAYFEGVEQYKTGVESNRRSKECFVDSVKRIYPGRFEKNQIEKFYEQSRCGLFHNGMTKGSVILSYEYGEALKIEGSGKRMKIKISPKFLLADVKRDFEAYVNKLRQHDDHPELVRENFDRLYSVLPDQQ